MDTCSIEGCESVTSGRGFCHKHYMRWYRNGNTNEKKRMPRQPCIVDGCDRMRMGRGYCKFHYQQQKRRGGLSARPCSIDGCSGFVEGHDLCSSHLRRLKLYGDPLAVLKPGKDEGKGHVEGRGYRVVWAREHPNARSTGHILEHVLVMSEYLGRPLRKGETVHHRNGIRLDNRIENLELWSSNHSSGQRVTDLVAFARDVLAKYEVEVEGGLHD